MDFRTCVNSNFRICKLRNMNEGKRNIKKNLKESPKRDT